VLLGGADGVLLGGALGVLLGGALGVLVGRLVGVTLGGALLGGVGAVALGGSIPAVELGRPVTGLASRNSVVAGVAVTPVGDCDGGALWMHPDTTTVLDEGDCGWADCAAAGTLTTAPIARTAAMFRVM
jgi:hypothetical protein